MTTMKSHNNTLIMLDTGSILKGSMTLENTQVKENIMSFHLPFNRHGHVAINDIALQEMQRHQQSNLNWLQYKQPRFLIVNTHYTVTVTTLFFQIRYKYVDILDCNYFLVSLKSFHPETKPNQS